MTTQVAPLTALRDCQDNIVEVGDRVAHSTSKGQRVGRVIGMRHGQWGVPKFTLKLEKVSSYWYAGEGRRHTFEYSASQLLLLEKGDPNKDYMSE